MKNTLEKYGRIIALLHTLSYTIHSWQQAVGSSSVKQQNSTFHTIEFFPDGKRNRRTSHWQSYSNCFDETANCMITICQSNFDCIKKCKNSFLFFFLLGSTCNQLCYLIFCMVYTVKKNKCLFIIHSFVHITYYIATTQEIKQALQSFETVSANKDNS